MPFSPAENPHYRIVDSYIQNGRRSTLIIRESVSTDFGTYTCYVENSMGFTELEVELSEKRKKYCPSSLRKDQPSLLSVSGPLPTFALVITSFTLVVILLVIVIVVILCRRRLCSSRSRKGNKTASSNNAAAATNNLIVASNGFPPDQTATTLKQHPELETPSYSNEGDSAWGEGSSGAGDASQHQMDLGGFAPRCGGIGPHPPLLTQALLQREGGVGVGPGGEPEFPPKPDVITSGNYVPYGSYVREFSPPCSASGVAVAAAAGDRESPLYAAGQPGGTLLQSQSSLLNVSDPRFSATYGNPFLKQVISFPFFSWERHNMVYPCLDSTDWPREHALLHVHARWRRHPPPPLPGGLPGALLC